MDLSKLKQKLAKQKEKTTKTFFTVPKKAKAKSTSARQTEQRGIEEQNMRSFMSKLKEINTSDVSNSDIKRGVVEYTKVVALDIRKTQPKLSKKEIDEQVEQLWSDLPEGEQVKYILLGFANIHGVSWSRKPFIQQLVQFYPASVKEFIKEYLAQKLNYPEFFQEWQERPDVIEKLEEIEKKEIGEEKEVVPRATRNALLNEALERAKEFAEKKGIAVEKNDYYSIIDQIIAEENPSIVNKLKRAKKKGSSKVQKYQTRIEELQQKLHQEISEKLIEQVRELGVEDAETLTLGELISKVIHPSSNIKERLIIKATKLDIDNPQDYDIITLKEKIREEEAKLTLKKRKKIIKKKIKAFKKRPQQPGIKSVVYDPDLAPEFDRVSAKTKLESLSTSDIAGIAKSYQISAGEKSKEELIENILDKQREEASLVDEDRSYLAHKLAKIMGLNVSYFRDWDISDLQRKYDEEGGEMVIEADEEIDQEMEDQKDKQKYAKIASTCVTMLSSYGWIDTKVIGVWLAAVEGKSLDMRYVVKDSDPLETYINDQKVLWYSANARFKVLQCLAKSRVQQGNVLTCISFDGERLDFMVGYTVNGSLSNLSKYGKFVGYANSNTKNYYFLMKQGQFRKQRLKYRSASLIVQDEDMFDAEQRFMAWKRKTKLEKTNDILNRVVSGSSFDMVASRLSREMIRVAPRVKDYGQLNSRTITPYIRLVIDNLGVSSKETNKTLFTAVANILVYLELPQAQIFRKRIRGEYYLPESLAILSPEDKLPEILGNPVVDDEIQEEMATFIRSEVDAKINYLAEAVYRLENPTEQRYSSATSRFYPDMEGKFLERMGKCENADEVEDIPPEEIIFYKEDGKMYCFPIKNLLALFNLGEKKNPKTGKRFSKEFIKKFTKTYSVYLKHVDMRQEDVIKAEEEKAEEAIKVAKGKEERKEAEKIRKSNMIMPKMWDIIVKDIAEREEEMVSEKSKESEESEESESGDSKSEESKESESKSKKEEKRGGATESDACEYCKKHVNIDSGFKSVIWHDEKSRIIKFCNLKCFEEIEFPKIKKTKNQKRKQKSPKKKR